MGPNDGDSVAVRPGQDLVTLLTCHPYGTTRDRYLGVFERTTDPDDLAAFETEEAEASGPLAAVVAPLTEALEPCDSPALVAERWARVFGLAVMAFMLVWAIGRLIKHARK